MESMLNGIALGAVQLLDPIVMLLIVSSIPYFLGLLVTLPVLGHATWHLYRRIVAPVGA